MDPAIDRPGLQARSAGAIATPAAIKAAVVMHFHPAFSVLPLIIGGLLRPGLFAHPSGFGIPFR
jgi:hypothetical protein